MKKLLTLFLLILTAATIANAQYHTTNKKAILQFEQGLSKYRAQQFDEAVDLADKAIKLDANFIEAYWLKADIAATLQRYDEEIDVLNQVLTMMPDDPTTIIGIADAYFDKYDNENALKYYQKLKSLDRAVDEKQRQRAEKKTELAEFRINALAHPVDFDPRNLGPKVNTVYNDYFPSLSADGNTLVYTIELPQTAQNPHLPKT
ncbi:MAG: tetratricopeptide repeat protein, partial [Bacteroidales bacterium]|nr:tetratricopeptide repeat protein [Bacteroidales bacterium]